MFHITSSSTVDFTFLLAGIAIAFACRSKISLFDPLIKQNMYKIAFPPLTLQDIHYYRHVLRPKMYDSCQKITFVASELKMCLDFL